MTPIEAVFRKELLDHVRDRRSLAAALAVPLVGPVLLAAALTLLAAWMGQMKPLTLSIEGAQAAPGLVRFLEQRGTQVVREGDVEALVRSHVLDVAVRVPRDYPARVSQGATALLEIITDGARPQGAGALRRTERLLEEYAALVRAQRLSERGLAPALGEPLLVDTWDIATPEQQAGKVLNAVPLFLLLAAFLCTAQIALDVAAGERERGSLEPLLLNPMSSLSLVVGKWLSAVMLGLLGTALTALATAVLLTRIPLSELGLRVTMGVQPVLIAFLILMPLVAFTAALQLLLATWARSYKEAQTYVSLVLLLPTAPGILLALNPGEPGLWTSIIPGLGQQMLLLHWVRGETLDPSRVALAVVGCALGAFLSLSGAARLMRQEGVILGR